LRPNDEEHTSKIMFRQPLFKNEVHGKGLVESGKPSCGQRGKAAFRLREFLNLAAGGQIAGSFRKDLGLTVTNQGGLLWADGGGTQVEERPRNPVWK
jgi:hypothetical protein